MHIFCSNFLDMIFLKQNIDHLLYDHGRGLYRVFQLDMTHFEVQNDQLELTSNF